MLTAKPRWGDDPYALRIIVDQLTKGGRDEETGYGLMLKPDAEDSYNDNNPSVVIDLAQRSMQVRGHDEHDGSFTFEQLKQLAEA